MIVHTLHCLPSSSVLFVVTGLPLKVVASGSLEYRRQCGGLGGRRDGATRSGISARDKSSLPKFSVVYLFTTMSSFVTSLLPSLRYTNLSKHYCFTNRIHSLSQHWRLSWKSIEQSYNAIVRSARHPLGCILPYYHPHSCKFRLDLEAYSSDTDNASHREGSFSRPRCCRPSCAFLV